jgi:Zn-dependent protease/predicted transcriptional regulator
MTWSFRIGRFFGIDVFVHATFFLLLAWFVGTAYLQTRSAAVALDQLIFILLVFTIVVMHEYGHALTARAFGVQTRDITLLPIGGVARLERIPENPIQEFLIAIAGPAVNVVLAILCGIWVVTEMKLAGPPPVPPVAPAEVAQAGEAPVEVTFMAMSWPMSWRLLIINVVLVVFNLIPAFPMDGGRILRSLLAMNMDYARATRIAATIGQFIAVVFGVIGLFNPNFIMLLLIALFVWIGASQEARAVEQRSALAGVTVQHAMITQFVTVNPYDPLDVVAQHVLDGFQHDFPVMHGDEVVGVITRDDLLTALAREGRDARVSEVMQREFVIARPDEPLTEIVAKLQQCSCHSLPVMVGDKLVGLITSENIGEFMMIRSAVEQNAQRAEQ